MKNIKIKRKTVMIGAAAVIALILAGVSAYAIGSGGNGFRTVVDETPVSITKADAEKIALENVKGATEKDITESIIDRDEAGTEYDIEILSLLIKMVMVLLGQIVYSKITLNMAMV